MTGVVIGRFQPLHNGHFRLINHGFKYYSNVIVVIGSADKAGTDRNPWSCYQRVDMLNGVFPGVKHVLIDDHPSDEEWTKNLQKEIPADSVILVGNSESLEKKGYGFIKYPFEQVTTKGFHAIYIRELIKTRGEWQKHVPPFVAGYVTALENTNAR